MSRMLTPSSWDVGIILIWVVLIALVVWLAIWAFKDLVTGDGLSRDRPINGGAETDGFNTTKLNSAKGGVDDSDSAESSSNRSGD